MGADTSAHAHY